MRRAVLLVALMFVGGGLIGGAAAYQNQQQPRVRNIQKVRENLYFISGGDLNDRSTWTGGNVAVLVADKGVVVVDTMPNGSGVRRSRAALVLRAPCIRH